MLLAIIVFGEACKKENKFNSATTVTTAPGDGTIAPVTFDFKTTKAVSITNNLVSNNNEPQ